MGDFDQDVSRINSGSLFGDFLYKRVDELNTVYDFFIELCIVIHSHSAVRTGVTYRNKDDSVDTEAFLSDSDKLYKYQDLIVFYPILWRIPDAETRRHIWDELGSANRSLLESFRGIGDDPAPKDTFRSRVLAAFHSNGCDALRDKLESIPKNLRSWPTFIAPLVWNWLHIGTAMESKLENLPGIQVHYVGLLIMCSQCFEHWYYNMKFFEEFFRPAPLDAIETRRLGVKLLRLHNAIRILYRYGNSHAYSPRIKPFAETMPDPFEVFLLEHYTLAAAAISKKVAALKWTPIS